MKQHQIVAALVERAASKGPVGFKGEIPVRSASPWVLKMCKVIAGSHPATAKSLAGSGSAKVTKKEAEDILKAFKVAKYEIEDSEDVDDAKEILFKENAPYGILVTLKEVSGKCDVESYDQR